MKKKTVWITAAILGLCLVAVMLVQAYRSILIEGTITDEQGNAMNGVSAHVCFLRQKGKDRFDGMKELEETVDSSFHFEGKGDAVFVVFAKKGYAPGQIHLDRGRGSQLIRRDLRIIMKKTTQEKIAESLFAAMDLWTSFDCIVIEAGDKWPTTEERLEEFRKAYVLEKKRHDEYFHENNSRLPFEYGKWIGKQKTPEVGFLCLHLSRMLSGSSKRVHGIDSKDY